LFVTIRDDTCRQILAEWTETPVEILFLGDRRVGA
jgi:hypothetical protein